MNEPREDVRSLRWRDAQEAGLVVLPPEAELWFNSSWHNVLGQGYGWRVEAVSGDGFNESHLGAGLSYWAARWAMRRAEKRLRKQYREWSEARP